MAKDKKGKGSGTKDACYHKVKARYSVWPSAYASGALVKCRKKGAANWGNKSESFEVQEGRPMYDPERVKKATSLPAINPKQDPRKNEKNQKIGRSADAGVPNADRMLKKRTGGASLPPKFKEELNIDLAVDYFFTEGINEDGLNMIIEETGLEKFVEFVEYLTDIEVLTEARAARKARKGAKSYEQVKAEIDAKEKAKSAKREISVDKTKKATATAKAKQPEKKPVRDAIARGVFRAVDAYKKGMERHNAAMATAKKAGKVAGKAAGEFAKGAGEGVKTAGKVAKVAYKVASEEVELEEKKKSGDPCWVGYKQVGMKKKGAKMVPNCVPEETEVEEGYKPIDRDKENKMYRRAGNLARTSLSSKGKKKLDSASKSAKIVSAISRQKENERFDKMADEKARSNYNEEVVQSILEKCWAGYEKKGMKTMFGKRYPNCVKKKATRKEEVEQVAELYKGKHGQTEKEYQDSRSDAGKMISGDSKGSGANYSYKAKNTGPNPAGGSKKPQGQARMGKKDRDYLAYRKANLKKDVAEGDSAFDFVKNELIKKHGAAAIIGTPENKAATAKRREEAKKNKKKPAPDTRTDAQKMTDATGPRPGSRYRGD